MSFFDKVLRHFQGGSGSLRAAAQAPDTSPAGDPLNGEEGLVPEAVIAKVRALSRLDMLAAVTADRARWFVAFLVLGAITLFSAFGWHVADKRFSDNVRVAWVKLDPSGAYTVDFAEDVRPVEFFQTTLESKLTEFVQRRYRRNAATIASDYRFVGTFLSPQLRTQFMSSEDYNAARVAAELAECNTRNCTQRDVRVRVVQHRTRTPLSIPDKANSSLYETLVFLTFIERKFDGTVLTRRNAIVQMTWRIKGKDEIVADKASLVANPLGIEVMSLDLKEDPTPVARDDAATN